MVLTTNRRSLVLVSLTVFFMAVAMRTIPLFWSPLPFNTDGFHFARMARETLSIHHLPLYWQFLQPDEYVFTMLLATTSRITGVSPLFISQILIACIGATLCLFAINITYIMGSKLGWSDREIHMSVMLAGGVLATEGIFLGRSTAVSSEGVGHLFVLLSLFTFAYALLTARPAWVLIAGLYFLAFPLTHNLSTIIAAFSSLSLLTLYYRDSSVQVSPSTGLLIVGLWVYSGIYFTFTEINQVSRISSVPGLFVAWIIILILLSLWLPMTQPRIQRYIPLAVLIGGGGLVLINYFVPVFPGTATGGEQTLLFILPLLLLGIIAFWGFPYVMRASTGGYAIAALVVGTLSLVGFALTAGLTVKYQGLAIRGQIFIHIAVAVLVGLGTIGLSRNIDWPPIRMMLGTAIIICSAISAPLAFSGLRATSAQPLVTQAEFETGAFAAKYVDQWTSDGHMTRLSKKYYPRQTNASQARVYSWLRGNSPPPNCPLVSQRSWITVGAQLFPASPKQITRNTYRELIKTRSVIYSNSGEDPLIVSISKNGRGGVCQNTFS